MLSAAVCRTRAVLSGTAFLLVNYNVRQAIILILEVREGRSDVTKLLLPVRAVGTRMRTQVGRLVKSLPCLRERAQKWSWIRVFFFPN